MLARIGVAMSAEETMTRFLGRSSAAVLAIIAETRGAPPPASFAAEWDDLLFSELGRHVTATPDVTAALDALRVPTCVASSGSHERMRITLGATGLLPRFEGRLFSATEVARGKPFPDLFLHAAAVLGAVPARTAVVEDSPVGAAAGVAAGMTVFGYTGLVPAHATALRDAGARCFVDFRELAPLVNAEDAAVTQLRITRA